MFVAEVIYPLQEIWLDNEIQVRLVALWHMIHYKR